jgi:hypothetical protein
MSQSPLDDEIHMQVFKQSNNVHTYRYNIFCFDFYKPENITFSSAVLDFKLSEWVKTLDLSIKYSLEVIFIAMAGGVRHEQKSRVHIPVGCKFLLNSNAKLFCVESTKNA